MFKKLLSLTLGIVMLMGVSSNAFAAENSNITTLRNDSKLCIVKEVNHNNVTIATNDKTSNVLTVAKYDFSGTNLISKQIIDLNTISKENKSSNILKSRSHWGNGDSYQHTFSDREFDIWYGKRGEPNEWKIAIPKSSRTVKETKYNERNLESFRSAVEDVNESEYIVIGAVGGTVAATAISAFVSAGTAAGIAAAGGTSVIVAAFASLNKACNNADYYYKRV